jgi:hypothetical protein
MYLVKKREFRRLHFRTWKSPPGRNLALREKRILSLLLFTQIGLVSLRRYSLWTEAQTKHFLIFILIIFLKYRQFQIN